MLFLFVGFLLYAYYGGASYQELGLLRADGLFPKFIVEEMPVGISGLIVAALFAAAMSTLSSSLSSLSSAATLDIYIPLLGKGKSEADLLKISRIITLVWGIVLIITASLFIQLEESTTVVEFALGIASYTYGGLLGAFLLGIFSRNASQKDAIIGFFTALVVMIVVIQTIQIAWPLYTVVGSITAISVGILSRILNHGSGAKT
jgi:Na+/proline symporter